MIFVIKNCYPDQYENDIIKQQALSNLLRSHAYRCNLVFAEKKLFEKIIDSSLYGCADKKFASDILDSLREHYQLLEIFSFSVEIDFEFSGMEVIDDNQKKIIKLGYAFFSDNKRTSSMIFLSENTLDIKLYEKIGTFFLKKNSIGTSIDFSPHNGGGSQTKDSYIDFKKDNKLCLCIIDTDKKHPSGSEGSTALRFKHRERGLHGTTFVKVLDVHEVECLIPLKIVEDVLRNNSYPSDIIDHFDKISKVSSNIQNFRDFFDHKKGINLKEAIEIDRKYGSFYSDAFLPKNGFEGRKCLSDRECLECGSCLEIKGFGSDLLAHSVEILDKKNLINLSVESRMYNHWNNIGMLVANWGCVPPERRVRS